MPTSSIATTHVSTRMRLIAGTVKILAHFPTAP